MPPVNSRQPGTRGAAVAAAADHVARWGRPGVFIPKSDPGSMLSFEGLLRRYPRVDVAQRTTRAKEVATPLRLSRATVPSAVPRPLVPNRASPTAANVAESLAAPTVAAMPVAGLPGLAPGRDAVASTVAISPAHNDASEGRAVRMVSVRSRPVAQAASGPMPGARPAASPPAPSEVLASPPPAAAARMPFAVPNPSVPSPLSKDDFRRIPLDPVDRALAQATRCMRSAAKAGLDLLATHFIGRLVGVVKLGVAAVDLALATAVQLPLAALRTLRHLPDVVRDSACQVHPPPSLADKLSPGLALIGAAWGDLKSAAVQTLLGTRPEAAQATGVSKGQAAKAVPAPRSIAQADAVDAVRRARDKWELARKKAGFKLAACTFVSRFASVALIATSVGIAVAATVATGGIAPLALAGLIAAGLSLRLAAMNAWCAAQNAQRAHEGRAALPMGASAIANATYEQLRPVPVQDHSPAARAAWEAKDQEARRAATQQVTDVALVQIATGLGLGGMSAFAGATSKLADKIKRFCISAAQLAVPGIELKVAGWIYGEQRGAEQELVRMLRDLHLDPASLSAERLEAEHGALLAELDGFGLKSAELLRAVAGDGPSADVSDLAAWFKDAQAKAAAQNSTLVWQAANAVSVDRGLSDIVAAVT